MFIIASIFNFRIMADGVEQAGGRRQVTVVTELTERSDAFRAPELSQPLRGHLSAMIRNTLGDLSQFLGLRGMPAVRLLTRIPVDALVAAINGGASQAEIEGAFGSLQSAITGILSESGRTPAETSTMEWVDSGAFNLHQLLTMNLGGLIAIAAQDLSRTPEKAPESEADKALRLAADRLSAGGARITIDKPADDQPDPDAVRRQSRHLIFPNALTSR